MGLLKGLGKAAGSIAGAAIGLPVYLAGEVVNSDLLREIGDGAFNVTQRTGEMLGNVTEGAAEAIYGTVKSDSNKQSSGMGKIIDSGTTYAKGIAKGVTKIASDGIEALDAIVDGDKERAVKVGKELAKTAAVGVLSIGILDAVDGMDGLDGIDSLDNTVDMADVADGTEVLTADAAPAFAMDPDELIENPNEHYVTPHERVLPDGRVIWVDGDGDTSVNTGGGWVQSNPDYRK